MSLQSHIKSILVGAIYLIAVILFASSNYSGRAIVITALALIYVVANIIFAAHKGHLKAEFVIEIGLIALLAQYVILFVI